MSKVQGPLFSLKATGTFANTLTFQSRKSHTVVFISNKPYDPANALQQIQRAYFLEGISYWHGLSSTYQTQWGSFVT